MKITLTTALLLTWGLSAAAQTNMPNGGQTPPQGTPSTGYPNNGPQGGTMGNQYNGPQGGTMGNPQNGPQGRPVAQWPAGKCQKEIPKLEKFAMNCLNQKKEDQRRKCFDNIDPKFPREFWESCEAQREPLKAKIEAVAAQKYPGQNSGLGGNDNQGGQQMNAGQPGQNGPQGGAVAQWPAEKCQKEIPKLEKFAMNCLNQKKEDQRRKCFDNIDPKFPREFWESCEAQREPLKAKIEAVAAQKYPGQNSGLGGNDNQGGQQMNAGQPGQNGPQGGAVAQWPTEKCQKEVPKLEKLAMNCIKLKKEDQRKKCFDGVEPKFPREFWEGCRAQAESVKSKMEGIAAEKYPGQGTGIGGDKAQNQGPHDGTHGAMNSPSGHEGQTANRAPAKECGSHTTKIENEGNKCLKMKDQAKRKACFDKVGDQVEKNQLENLCGESIATLKTEFQTMEAKTFPNDPPSIN